MFNEISNALHVEGSLVTDGVVMREKLSQPLNIKPSLQAETDKLNAGKTINVAELDKPIRF